MKKIYIGLMAIAIVGLLLASGCVKPTPKPQPPSCVKSEPTTLSGYNTELRNLYGSSLNILGSTYTLRQEEGMLGYINNQGNSVILVIPIELAGMTSCSDFVKQVEQSDRFVSKRIVADTIIYRSRESSSQQAEQSDIFCSKDDTFLIQFEPVWDVDVGGTVIEVLNLEDKYFKEFLCE